ncbi:MAG TPA: RecX family transcriptional regulator [Flavobacteriia bacterium]|jgi:regulatory protein|nr:RecX family transcriptional regulator [Flavobacteriia bacterium]
MQKKNNNDTYLSYEDAKLKMEKFCIYQDRCHFDVEKKLRTLQVSQDSSNQIIMDLIQDDFLNEERFAKNFVRGKFNQKKWGKTKLTFELKKRAVHENLIKNALTEIDLEEYHQVIKTQYQKKEASIKETNSFLKRKKVISYLLNRGFEYALIKEVEKEM